MRERSATMPIAKAVITMGITHHTSADTCVTSFLQAPLRIQPGAGRCLPIIMTAHNSHSHRERRSVMLRQGSTVGASRLRRPPRAHRRSKHE
jgi:hypothetical protein